MKALRRLFLWSFLLTAVLAPGWIWLQSRDLPELKDRDLILEPVEIPREEDGAVYLTQAAEQLDLGEEESRLTVLISTHEGWDSEAARALLVRNEAGLAGVDQALGAPYFRIPVDANTPTPEIIAWQRLAKLMVLRAALFAEQGDPWAAAGDWQRVLALAAHVERAYSGSLLTGTVGLSLRSLALDSIRDHAAAGLLPADVGLELAGVLPAYRSHPKRWAELWTNEYWLLTKQLGRSPEEVATHLGSPLEDNSLLRRLLPQNYHYHPRRTQAEFARYFRSRARQSALPCAVQTRPAIEQTDLADPWARRRRQFEPNGVGSLILQVGFDHYADFGVQRCAADSYLEATRTLLALSAYETQGGALPESLTELVPDYLETGPIDAFDGLPLRYSQEGRFVYSIGDDFFDRGGDPGAGWSMAEPTLPLWSLPGPAAEAPEGAAAAGTPVEAGDTVPASQG